jgi:hypothetical protein
MRSITRKSSPLKPRYRAYSERKYSELDHTLSVLEEIRNRLQAEGHYAAELTVTGAMCDVPLQTVHCGYRKGEPAGPQGA